MALITIFCIIAAQLIVANAKTSCPDDEYCLKNNLSEGLYANPTAADHYISCQDTLTFCMPCQRHHTWDDELKRCILSNDVERHTNGKSHCPEDFCKGKKDGDYANPPKMDQHYFIKCFVEHTYCFECQGDLVYNATLDECIHPKIESTSVNFKTSSNKSHCPEDFCKGKKNGDYANPPKMDQHFFIKCFLEHTYCFACEGGLIYNATLNMCIYPKNEFASVNYKTSSNKSHCPEDFCKGKKNGDYANPPKMDQHFFIKCFLEHTYCFACEGGLIYNATLNMCIYPKIEFASVNYKTSSNKSHCPTDYCKGKKDGDYANPAKMDQHYFIKCSSGITHCFECPSDLVYNATLNQCVYPKFESMVHEQNTNSNKSHCPTDFCKGKKDGDYANPAKMDQHYFVKCSSGITHCFECPSDLVYNATLNQCVYPKFESMVHEQNTNSNKSHCPTDFCKGKKDGDYANPAKMDQHYFVKCSSGITHCFECPSDLVYNATLNQCVYPKFESMVREHNTNSNKSHCPTDFCEGKKDGDYANPAKMDQHYFIKCSSGITHCFECPSDLVYNATLNQCVYPKFESMVHEQNTNSNKSHCPTDFCEGKKDGDYANPAKMDQHYFIKCSSGITHCFECPSDLVYNATLNQCVYPKLESAIYDYTTNSNKSHCPTDFCKNKTDGDYPNPAKMDQHYFMKCSSGMTYCFKCPAGLVWNEKRKRCDYPTKVDAKSQCPKKFCQGKKDGSYANPAKKDQHYFIMCSNGYTFCFHCPGGLVWNDETKSCDHPEESVHYIKF